VRNAVGVLLLSSLVAVVLSSASCARPEVREEHWEAGYREPAWRLVDELQRYPLCAGPSAGAKDEPDWEKLCRHDSPAVRAAAALAVGRTGDRALLPVVLPLLGDEWPAARWCAFWAVLSLPDESMGEPLLGAVADLPRLQPLTRSHALTAGAGDLFERTGLPRDLVTAGRDARRAWVAGLDRQAWLSVGPTDAGPAGLGGAICVAESQRDAGSPMQILADSWQPSESARPSEAGGFQTVARWYEVLPDGRIREPTASATVDVMPGRPTDLRAPEGVRDEHAGVFLLQVDGLGSPLLLRVTRSPAFEERLPELVPRARENKIGLSLARNKVAEAGPVLLAALKPGPEQASETDGDACAAAWNLARLGDAGALPWALDAPGMGYWGLWNAPIGDLLKLYGEAAHEECDRRIADWQDYVSTDGQLLALTACIDFRRSGLSPQQRDSVAAAVEHVSSEIAAEPAERNHAKCSLVRAGITALAGDRPDLVAEALWRQRHAKASWTAAADSLAELPPAVAEPIVRSLWASVDREGLPMREASNALNRATLAAAPDILLRDGHSILLGDEDSVVQAAWQEGRLPAYTERRLVERALASYGPYRATDLAFLYLRLGRYEDCLAILRQKLSRTRSPREAGPMHFAMGQAHLALGNLAEAVESLQRVDYPLRQVGNRPILDAALAGLDPRDELRAAETALRDPNVRVSVRRMPRRLQEPWVIGGAGGVLFYLDELRRLCSWDPVSRAGSRWAAVPLPCRAALPLDRDRVIVLCTDGVARLYERGSGSAAWSTRFAWEDGSCAASSSGVLAVAGPSARLRLLDIATGKLLCDWRMPSAVGPEGNAIAGPSIVCVDDRGVLVARPGAEGLVMWCDRAGEPVWSRSVGCEAARICIGAEVAVVASPSGALIGLSLADGDEVWRRPGPAAAPPGEGALFADSAGDEPVVVQACGPVLRALSLGTGEPVWSVALSPSGRGGAGVTSCRAVRLCSFGRAVCAAVQWAGDTRQADVLLVTGGGRLLLHESTRLADAEPLAEACLSGTDLFIRAGRAFEVWDLSRLAPGTGG
jgi:hypothetical protein